MMWVRLHLRYFALWLVNIKRLPFSQCMENKNCIKKMSSNLWLRFSVLILTSHWLVLMLEFVNISSCDYFRFRFSTVCPKLLQWLCAPALINTCHSPVGRSVFGKTVPSVLSTTRDRGHSFAPFGPTSAGDNIFIFFYNLTKCLPKNPNDLRLQLR